jgi:tetratricopeptide (TPR) repeat protein
MRQYTRGNYAACISGLRAALKLEPDAPDARFYLGINYLLTSNKEKAIEELRRTAELGDTPYLDGAHFYLAKAYLRENDLTHAEDELKKTIGIHRSYEVEAGNLLRELRSIREGQH